jgi:hypothetical protein
MKKAGGLKRSAALRLGGILLLLGLGLGLAAGCNVTQTGMPAGGPGASGSAPPATETLAFTLLQFADATVDLTLTVVDQATLATIYSLTSTGQVTPASATYSYAPTPVAVTVSVKFNHLPAGSIQSGTNTTPGTPTLTVAVPTFFASQFKLPLFVLDAVPGPSELVDVTSVSSLTTLGLAGNFTAPQFFLFQSRQLTVRIDHSYIGTESRIATFTDDTLLTQQFTTAF